MGRLGVGNCGLDVASTTLLGGAGVCVDATGEDDAVDCSATGGDDPGVQAASRRTASSKMAGT